MARPPSINLINLSSSCKSLKLYFLPFIPRQIIPKAHPAANEYPSLSKHLSLLGRFPICDNVISVMVRLHVPLCRSPTPISALVCTLIGISTSILGGKSTGMWRIRAFDRASSDFPILETLTPRRTATEVN